MNLAAEGVLLVKAPRREPWGRGGSKYVYAVSGPTPINTEGSAVQIGIELQSGDVLEIEASSIVVSPAASTPP